MPAPTHNSHANSAVRSRSARRGTRTRLRRAHHSPNHTPRATKRSTDALARTHTCTTRSRNHATPTHTVRASRHASTPSPVGLDPRHGKDLRHHARRRRRNGAPGRAGAPAEQLRRTRHAARRTASWCRVVRRRQFALERHGADVGRAWASRLGVVNQSHQQPQIMRHQVPVVQRRALGGGSGAPSWASRRSIARARSLSWRTAGLIDPLLRASAASTARFFERSRARRRLAPCGPGRRERLGRIAQASHGPSCVLSDSGTTSGATSDKITHT